MSRVALNILTGHKIYSEDFNDKEWDDLRAVSELGHIKMACCEARAVLKTSPGFRKFFAHYSGECATSPESKWHMEVKSLIARELALQGVSCVEEKTGRNRDGKKWKADIYFEVNNRKVAIEIQHSYQHLKKYHERQKIYVESGVECYWILFPERFYTLTSAIANYRLVHEFNNVIPPGFYGNTSDIPAMWAEVDTDVKIKGVAFIEYSLALWIKSVLDKKFRFENFKWSIDGQPLSLIGKR